MITKLRDYQFDAADGIMLAWQSHNATLLDLATGLGKTVVFSAVLKAMQPGRAMVLAHTEELIWQARNKLEEAGLRVEVEMAELKSGGSFDGDADVIVSTVQTQNSKWLDGSKRVTKFHPEDFSVLVIDECFPAGTLVDGRPIETIQQFDSITTHQGIGTVTRLFKTKAETLCRLRFDDGRELIATLNHPVWTPLGYFCAAALTVGDVVLTITPYEAMRHLRKRSQEQAVPKPGVTVGNDEAEDCEDVSEARRSDHQVSQDQRHERSSNAGVGVRKASGDGVETESAAREWTSSDDSSTGIGIGSRVGDGSWDSDAAIKNKWLSDLLQGGHWEPQSQSRRGGGREFSLRLITPESGREERRIASFARLVSREILEPGSGGEFERLCPDGFVYNLEVSNGNTYFANGVLVHNCHHAAAGSYREIIAHYRQNPKLKVLGVTATPDRADELALGEIFDCVAFHFDILDGINNGWLVPITQQMVHIEGLDFSKMRTTAGDLNGADLAAVMEAENNLQGVAGSTIKIVGNKRTLVFAVSVKQAEVICEIFNRHKPNCARWVSGKTNKDERRETVAAFGRGDFQILCNCNCFAEGFDVPGVEVVVVAKPTKSRTRYAQYAGRGTRALPGIVDGPETPELRRAAIAASAKPSLLIVDFCGNAGKHKLISAADILGGKSSADAVMRAKKKAEKNGTPLNVLEALKSEEEKLAAEKEERLRLDRARKARIVADVAYRMTLVDPFDRYDVKRQPPNPWEQRNGIALSEKQRITLQKMGVNPDEISVSCGRKLLGARFNGPCTEPQARTLRKYGYPAECSFKEACKIIDAIKANNWNRPPEPPSDERVISPEQGKQMLDKMLEAVAA